MRINIKLTRKKIFIITTLGSIGLLIALPFVFIPEDLSFPDGLTLEEVYTYDYGNSSLELKVSFRQIGWGIDYSSNGIMLSYRLILSTSSTGDLLVSGFTSYYHNVDINSIGKDTYSESFNLTENVAFGDLTPLVFYGDNVTFYCNTEINFTLGGVPQNDVFNFQLRFQNTQTKSDFLAYEEEMEWRGVATVFYFLLYIIIPIVLFIVIRPIDFRRSLEVTEKDDDYTDFLKKKHEELEDHDNTQ